MVNDNITNRAQAYCSRRLGGRGSYPQEARVQRVKEVLTGAFASDDKMLGGKNYPQTFERCCKEVLRSVIEEDDFSVNDIMTKLDSCSRTGKLWRVSLIKPVIIMIASSRVAHTGGWLLQKKCYHTFMLLVATTIRSIQSVLCSSQERIESCADATCNMDRGVH